jgi:integrase
VRTLRAVARRSHLFNPEDVKAYVATAPFSQNRRQTVFEHLARFYRWRQIAFQAPKWRRVESLPFIPSEVEVNQLIGAVDSKRAAFLQLVKESACRPGEAWALRWIDLDRERNCVRILPEKGSRPRERRITMRLFAMLDALPKKWDLVFHDPALDPVESLDDFRRTFIRQRNLAAERLQNPRIRKICFKTLRHYTATMEYHKTKDILHVMQMLGHKSIKNTLVYTHLVSFETDEYVCSAVKTMKEAATLIEQGFEYVTEIEGSKLFRKRK